MANQQKLFQIALGSRNNLMSLQNNGSDAVSIDKIIENLCELFRTEDDEINNLIPNGIMNVKSGTTAKFKSEKILSSLIKVGMPIDVAVQTLELVIDELYTKAKQNHSLSTKEIRQHVADAIKKTKTTDAFDAEEWGYRYVRKYGHDNRRIVVYNYPEKGSVELSYSTVIDIIKDAFQEALPSQNVEAIGRRRYGNMASYIMEFVNGCDLYYIDYSILLSMIIEIARQPPHPWLITNNTREKLIQYNIDAVQSNIKQLRGADNMLPTSHFFCYYSEIIHHASSLILERYQWFLGENDFSSFFILHDLIKNYNNSDFQVIVNSNNAIQKLERDLVLAETSLEKFLKELAEIKKVIQSHKVSDRNTQLLLWYGEMALKISNSCAIDSIVSFFQKDWSGMINSEVIKNLHKVLCTLVHASNSRKLAIQSYFFRFVFQSLSINGVVLKPHYLVLYIDDSFDYSLARELTAKTYSDYVSVILITCNGLTTLEQSVTKIKEYTDGMYWCVPFSKEDFISILSNDNPAEFFSNKLSDWVV